MISIRSLTLELDGHEIVLDQNSMRVLLEAASITSTPLDSSDESIVSELTDDMPNDSSVDQDDLLHAIAICRKHSCPYLISLLSEYYFGVTGSGSEILKRLANYLAYKLRDFPEKMLLGESASSVLNGFNDMCGSLNAIALESKQKKHNVGAQLRILAAIKSWMRYLNQVDNLVAQKEVMPQTEETVTCVTDSSHEEVAVDNHKRFVLIVGNVIDGLHLYGPFSNPEKAGQYAEDNKFISSNSWIVVHMHKVD